MTPVGDRCLVEPVIPIDEDSVRAAKSKILLVRYEKSKPRPTQGHVIAVGNGPLIQESVQVGDRVIFGPHAGTHIHVEGKPYISLFVDDIITVLRGSVEELDQANNPLKPEEQL
jgi:co-chaperonin GroES (HSP10)